MRTLEDAADRFWAELAAMSPGEAFNPYDRQSSRLREAAETLQLAAYRRTAGS